MADAYTPIDGLKNAVSFPTEPVDEAAARKQIQDMFDQMLAFHNAHLAENTAHGIAAHKADNTAHGIAAHKADNTAHGIAAHKAESATNAHLAKNIGLEDTEGNFESNDVEGAMAELFTSVSDGKDLVGTAITDVDASVVVPTDPTFAELVTAIGQISTGKKWASGEKKSGTFSHAFKDSSNIEFSSGDFEVTDLDFQPKIIFLHLGNKPVCSINTNVSNIGMFKSASKPVDFALTGNATITANGFRLPSPSGTLKWYASE